MASQINQQLTNAIISKIFLNPLDFNKPEWSIIISQELKSQIHVINQIIGNKKDLKSLSITFKYSINQFESIVQQLKNLEGLKKISFLFCELPSDIENVKFLQEIDFLEIKTSSRTKDEQVILLGKSLENLVNLRHLKLTFHGEGIRGEFCYYFGLSMSKLVNLLTFSMTVLGFSTMKSSYLEHIIKNLTENENLISIYIMIHYCHMCSHAEAINKYPFLINQSKSLTKVHIEFEYNPTFKNQSIQEARNATLYTLIAFDRNISEFLTFNPKSIFCDLYYS